MTQKSFFKALHPRQNMFCWGCVLCVYHFWVTLLIVLLWYQFLSAMEEPPYLCHHLLLVVTGIGTQCTVVE